MVKKKSQNNNNITNQKINCDVNNCTHNIKSKEYDLNEIKVSSYNEVSEKKETICDSFESNECNCNIKE